MTIDWDRDLPIQLRDMIERFPAHKVPDHLKPPAPPNTRTNERTQP